ncbi:phosphatase [Pectinatus frisingensis]|jgi:exopolyphosphatase/guanosine-5'-triphosphate,3'-diphosphate pyrophosphatase|uniref:Ppx/GppA phosphatase family protein n=1 Tax=Pectinatus frisingensis TaxID=865 RepID=UPI0015F3A9D1|nr:phosphatase [Pectinatus frisingensis]
MYAIIDIGSNTIRLVIYKAENNSYTVLLNKKEMAALASYVHDNMMSGAGIDKACHALTTFKKIVNELNISNVYAFATAALRNVANSNQAVQEIEYRTGLKIDVISGRTEATLDFIGIAGTAALKSGLMIDIGGASTELVAYENMKIKQAVSLPLGSLSAYNKYTNHFFPNKDEREKISSKILSLLEAEKQINFAAEYQNICGVGGTIRAAKKLYNQIFSLSPQNNTIQAKYINNIIKPFLSKKNKNHIDRSSLDTLLDIVPERIRTILPGTIILEALVEHFAAQNIFVSQAGVREGYLSKIVLKEFDDIEV